MIDDHKRKRMTGIPKFLRSLFRMLDTEDPSIICWSQDGTSIQILSERRLENEILRKYFNHEKASSFQRQLNNFGFRKWTKTQSNVCTFSHQFFLRHRPELLSQVLRKSPRTTPKSTSNQENESNNSVTQGVFTFDIPKFQVFSKPNQSDDNALWDVVFNEEDGDRGVQWDLTPTNFNNIEPSRYNSDEKLWDIADFDMSFLLDECPIGAQVV